MSLNKAQKRVLEKIKQKETETVSKKIKRELRKTEVSGFVIAKLHTFINDLCSKYKDFSYKEMEELVKKCLK